MSRGPHPKRSKTPRRSARRPVSNGAETYRQRGDAYVARGKMRDAAESYRQGLRAGPEDAATWGKLGNVLACLGKIPEAIESINRALALEPNNVSLLTNLGILAQQAKRPEDAISCFRRALAADPEHPNALFMLAEALDTGGSTEAASELFERAVERYRSALHTQKNIRPADDHVKLGYALKRLGRGKEALSVLRQAVSIEPRHALAWIHMGAIYAEQQRREQAVDCYRRAVALKPSGMVARRELGCLLLSLDELDAASNSLRKVVVKNPDDATARHLLAAAEQARPEHAPQTYVAELFDGYAERFDHHLVGKLGYRAPWQLRSVFGRVSGVESAQWTVMDIGCGTGLCGPLFRDLAVRLIGVDLSEKMLEKARLLGVYDEICCEDAATALARETGKLDLVVAADVFIYVGDLSEVFAACNSALKEKGWLAFTTEIAEGDAYELGASGRYAHGIRYIESLADSCGFSVVHREQVAIRIERRQPVANNLFVLRKVGNKKGA